MPSSVHSWRAPVAVAASFAEEPGLLLLLSGGAGRWSYLLRRPSAWVQVGEGGGDPFAAVGGLLRPAPAEGDGPPFRGGVAGLAAYELGARLEPVPGERHPDWPDLACGRYESLLAFDHRERVVHAIGEAADWLDGVVAAREPGPLVEALTVDRAAVYEAAVADVVARIGAGEIFQANVARAWRGRLRDGARPLDLLVRLAVESPAPYAAYLRLEGAALVSNSPERFLAVDAGGRVETRPIKGTRPRGADAAEDERLASELLASAKERAENLMIVDLMRNDLSRVCVPGSVATPALFAVERYAKVQHLVSTVTGRLAPGRSAVDAFRAAFPPGSVTGAPKVQAMRVIAGHEPPRGPYCGALFWAGDDGAFDSSVLIRTAAFAEDADGWRVEARAGAGIVADSDPRAERLETEAKIAALHLGLTGAAG